MTEADEAYRRGARDGYLEGFRDGVAESLKQRHEAAADKADARAFVVAADAEVIRLRELCSIAGVDWRPGAEPPARKPRGR